MAQLAIKGHLNRGKEVIEILEMLGGKNNKHLFGECNKMVYLINSSYYGEITCMPYMTDAYIVFTLEEFLEKFPYKVRDKVIYHATIALVSEMKWDGREVIYTIVCKKGVLKTIAFFIQPYKEETMEENLTIQDIRDNNAEWLLKKLREMPAADTLRNISDLYDEMHKPQYPKTYDECREMFGIPKDMNIEWQHPILGYEIRLLADLQKLLICRDAYWKIAGEKMGLGKQWEPDWSNDLSKYYISFYNNKVDKGVINYSNKILAFPTEEIRDAFYENFKGLIEACKELL